jgi:hypothetical protein
MPSSTRGPFQHPASGGAPGHASGPSAGSGGKRYIIRAIANDDALGAFIGSIGANPAIRLVETIGPSAGPPHTVVVDTDADTAEQIRQRHQHQLTIEPDQPLSLFD